MRTRTICSTLACFSFVMLGCAGARAADAPTTVTVDWSEVVATSRTHISIQVCPMPHLRRGHPLHDKLFGLLRDLKASYNRLQPWFPYPRTAVAELEPPSAGRTHWDFSLIDPIVEDFMAASDGRPVIFTFGTSPAWMFDPDPPPAVPEDPDEISWSYSAGKSFKDPTMTQAAQYQARLANWFVNGGFTDELGKRHTTNHRYKIEYWEVGNEPDLEHALTPSEYTRYYDAVVEHVRRVAPGMKFAGPVISDAIRNPQYFVYFLDPANHAPGIPIDMVSYHFYSMADWDETPETMQYTLFREADTFLTAVRYVDEIRKRFVPNARTAVDELGSMLPQHMLDPNPEHPIPHSYWNLSGAMWAYIYANLVERGMDVVAAAELIDYPGQFASTTLVDWNTGEPNARYKVVKLLQDNFGPGDRLVGTRLIARTAFAQAFITPAGERRILLVNKRDRPITLTIPGASGGTQQIVDQSTSGYALVQTMRTDQITLQGLAVAVITFRQEP